MFKLRTEAVYEGVTHKGFWMFRNGQMKTACGKTLAHGTYEETNCWFFGDTDCPAASVDAESRSRMGRGHLFQRGGLRTLYLT